MSPSLLRIWEASESGFTGSQSLYLWGPGQISARPRVRLFLALPIPPDQYVACLLTSNYGEPANPTNCMSRRDVSYNEQDN